MQRILFFLIISSVAILCAACQPNVSADSYSVNSVGRLNDVERGVIIDSRQVKINSDTGTGTLAGGATGAAAGSTIGGSSRVNIIGGIGGAVAGGILGTLAEKGLSQQTGMEYVVRTSHGKLLSIVQGSEPLLHVGEHVLIIHGEKARVIPEHASANKHKHS